MKIPVAIGKAAGYETTHVQPVDLRTVQCKTDMPGRFVLSARSSELER